MHTHMILLESALHDQKIIFGTTFWDRLDNDTEGQEREIQLRTRFHVFQPGLVIRVGRDGGSKLLEQLAHPSLLVSDLMAGQTQSTFGSQDTLPRNNFAVHDETLKENKTSSHHHRQNRHIIMALISSICGGDSDE